MDTTQLTKCTNQKKESLNIPTKKIRKVKLSKGTFILKILIMSIGGGGGQENSHAFFFMQRKLLIIWNGLYTQTSEKHQFTVHIFSHGFLL